MDEGWVALIASKEGIVSRSRRPFVRRRLVLVQWIKVVLSTSKRCQFAEDLQCCAGEGAVFMCCRKMALCGGQRDNR